MATLALSVAGAVVGGFVGGPAGAQWGWMAGQLLGGVLFPPDGPPDQVMYGPRMSDTKVQTSAYGQYIPRIWGQMRLSGNIIWASPVEEVATSTTTTQGGKGGGEVSSTTTNFAYYRAIAVGLCEGPISSVDRIWANTELIYDAGTSETRYPFTFHAGDESQTPDSIIESYEGADNAPAYRGTSYIVWDRFPLSDFSNTLPQFSFELTE